MRQPKLNELQRHEINRRYSSGQWTMDELARSFGVHRRTIFRVLEEHGRTPIMTQVGPRERQILQIVDAFHRDGATYTAAVSLIKGLRGALQKGRPARAA